jgi:four helix bundle protein
VEGFAAAIAAKTEIGDQRSEVRDRRSDDGGQKENGKTTMTKQINRPQDLEAYRAAYALAMEIFRVSKGWSAEERYSLTDQIRRSSRSVCANLAEAWGKRRYVAHFTSKLTDADGENLETQTWLNFAHDCGYLDEVVFAELIQASEEVGRLLGGMLAKPESFCLKS